MHGVDYRTYRQSNKERITCLLFGFILGGLGAYMLFHVFLLSIILGIPCSFLAVRTHCQSQIMKRKKYLRLEFADLLASLTHSYGIGQNTINAFKAAEIDLTTQYNTNATIVIELKNILANYKNNISIEKSIEDLGVRSDLEEIRNFSEVFSICNQSGGNLRELVGEMKDLLGHKMGVEIVIETTMLEKKNEFRLMLILPFIMLFMLGLFGSDQFFIFSIVNVGSKMIAIILFTISYFIGRKITDIRV